MTSTPTTPLALPPVGSYVVDPRRSTASYSGRHMFGLGGVRAHFAVTSGRLTIADPVGDSHVEATLDAASFRSGNARRDRDVTAPGLLDVGRFPVISFASTSLQHDGDAVVVEGQVTAHGTSVPTRLRVTALEQADDGFRAHARAEHLDRYAFGVTGSKGMVGRYLDLEFDVLVVPAALD